MGGGKYLSGRVCLLNITYPRCRPRRLRRRGLRKQKRTKGRREEVNRGENDGIGEIGELRSEDYVTNFRVRVRWISTLDMADGR